MHIENIIFPNHFSVMMVQYDPTRVYVPGNLDKISYVRELTDGSLLKLTAPSDQEDDLFISFSFR